MDEKAKKIFQDLIGKEDARETPVAVKKEAAVNEDAAAPAKVAKNRKRKARQRKYLEAEGQLTIDVYQTPTEIVIQSTIAGVGLGKSGHRHHQRVGYRQRKAGAPRGGERRGLFLSGVLLGTILPLHHPAAGNRRRPINGHFQAAFSPSACRKWTNEWPKN